MRLLLSLLPLTKISVPKWFNQPVIPPKDTPILLKRSIPAFIKEFPFFFERLFYQNDCSL